MGPVARLRVRVQPRASREEIVGWEGDVLRARVTAPPAEGRANAALVALLAERLGVAKSRVAVARGHASRDKVIEVEGLSIEEARRLLG